MDPQTVGPHTTPSRLRPLRRRWLAVPAAGLAAVLFLAPLTGCGSPAVGQPGSPTASAPATVPGPRTPARPAKPAGPAAAAPTRISIEAANIDVKVLPLTPSAEELSSESLVPPLTLDAYWLTNYGVPGSGSRNTTYIAGHSWDGKEAPFNRLSDESLVGKAVRVTTAKGTLDYVVDSVTTHRKDTLKDSDIWNIVPNRIVLISCYTEDPWGKNVVVTASPAAR
jgi:hypothetical protein